MAYNAAGEGDLDRVFITNAELVDQYVGERLYGWGTNDKGQLGDGTANSSSLSPVSVSGGGSNWVQLSAGYISSAIKTDGTLWTWGSSGSYAIGDGINLGRSSPGTTAGGGTNWKQVSAGYSTTSAVAAIKSDGTLWTWGNGASGKLGTGDTSNQSSPVTTAGGGNNWKQVSCGDGFTTAVKVDGTLWTWGQNTSGKLGDWTAGTSRLSPAVVVGPPTLLDASINRQNIIFPQITTPTINGEVTRVGEKTMYFNGSSYLTFSSSSSVVPYGTENFTIEFWMNAVNYNSGYFYIPGVIEFWNQNGTSLRVFVNETNNGDFYVNLTPTRNIWQHVAFVRNGTSFTLYINGVALSTRTYASTYTMNAATQSVGYIGRAANNGTYYSGYIDQLRIIKGVAKYTASFTPSLYPMFDPISADPYYSNVSLLLKADDVANGANNNTFVDNSGNNLAITRNGNTTQGSFSPFAVEPGKWSNYFDGNGDILSFSQIDISADFTAECWVYRLGNAASGSSTVFGGSGPTTQLSIGTDGSILLALGGSWVINPSAANLVPLNIWKHIAWVKSGTTCKIYVDGINVATGTSSASPNSFKSVGGLTDYSNNGFNGYISNARLVNSALYTANFTPSTVPLTAVAGTSLLTCQDNRFVDNSINNFAITPAGDVKPVPTSPFSKSTDILAPYFDGSGDYLTTTVSETATGDFTFESWVYRTAATTGIVISNGSEASGRTYMYVTSGNALAWGVFGVSDYTLGGSVPINQWNHIAIVRSGSTVTGYINGTPLATTTTYSGTVGNVNGYAIGANKSGASPITGYISDARVVLGTALYTSNFTPPTQPLKAITNTVLLTCQSDTVDNSSNRFTVTKNGNVNVMPVVPYESPTGNSVYFDGSGDYLTTPNSTNFNAGTGDFTVEGWIYQTSTKSNPTIFSCFTYTSGILLRTQGSGTNAVNVFIVGADLGTFGSVPLNTWTHVAVSRASGTVRVFINGTQVGSNVSNTSNITAATNNYCMVGSSIHNSAAEGWIGYLSDVRYIVGTALYTADFIPPKINLAPIANTALLTCQDKVIKDNSTNNLTITTTGVTAPVQFGPFKPSDYYFGGSMYFDGTGDYLSVADNAALQFGTGDFTIETWFYRTSNTRNETVLAKWNTGGWAIIFYSGVAPYGYTNIKFMYGDASVTLYDPDAFPINRWVHIAVSRSGTTLRLFIDGVLKSSVTDSHDYNSTNALCIGNIDTLSSYACVGYVSNAHIVKGQALYTTNFTPSSKPALPVANTSLLLSGTNAGIVDSTGRNNLETVGDAQISTNYRKWNTGSIYFDGTSASSARIPATNEGLILPGDFTVEFWFYRALTTNPAECPIDMNANASNGIAVRFNSATGDDVYVGGTNIGSVTPYIKNQTWQHFAICRESGSVSVYVDGVKVRTGTNSNSLGGSGTFAVGYMVAVGGHAFTGYIDDLRVTKGVARYTKNFSVTTKPLAKIDSGATSTSLLTCQSSTIVDNSTNAFTITPNGNAAVSTFAPFVGTNSVYFDGTGDYLTVASSNAFDFGDKDFTVDLWVNVNDLLTQRGLFSKRAGEGDTKWIVTYVGTNGTIITYMTLDGSSWKFGTSTSSTITANTWNHLAFVRSGSEYSVYVNGVKNIISSSVTGSIYPNTDPFVVGGSAAGGTTTKGYISNFRVVKGQALYTSNFTLSDVAFPPVRSLPTRYVAPDANYSSVGFQMNPNEIVNLDYSGGWKQVASGASHCIGLKTDGTVWTWGLNSSGQLGLNNTTTTSYPISVPYFTNVKQVSAAQTHSAAVKSDGTLWTWGANANGQLGDGTTTGRSSPVTFISGGTNWKQVSVNYTSTLAVKTDGTLWACGYNGTGGLGDGTIINKSSPVQVLSGNISNWKTVSAGANFALGIAQD